MANSGILPIRGRWPQISETAFIAATATVIGDVVVGPGSGIWYNCVLRGDTNEIRIGHDTNIQDGTVVHVDSRGSGTYIGDRVTIGHMALIHACTLEDGCMIGMQATVMDGAVVETGAMVAAGALVLPGRRVATGEVWGGNPARKLKEIGEVELDMLEYIWPHYRELADEHIAAGHDIRMRSEKQ